MKKLIFKIYLLLLLLMSTASAQQFEMKSLLPPYWIVGTLPNLDVLTSADGRVVDFYRTKDDLDAGRFARTKIIGNRFILNAFEIWPAVLEVGVTYNVATEMIEDKFGANGTVAISGRGWDEVKNFTLTSEGGIIPPVVDDRGNPVIREAAPVFNIWIGQRLYQKEMIEKGEKLIVSPKPSLAIDISIEEPFTLSEDVGRYGLILDQGTPVARNLVLTPSHITQKVYAAGSKVEEKRIRSFRLEYQMLEALSGGTHTFYISARSSGKNGIPAVLTEPVTVEVMGGPLRLVGAPLSYPNPFSITKNGKVTIQYALSSDADIEIILVDITGERVKRFMLNTRQEGGTAGINKITWDGRKDAGTLAGNGIYLGTIISRSEGKQLGTFKLAVVD
ncbi:hypothetical protein HZB08_00250 [Candidatus Saganbacteria bacterium]|uniref:FlgD/Vpr Ig-like domain-containing protein n=1 Tax=Candidatus Saganbacteria bacterium TaxID=2575572 RepID=A0A9D6YXD4_UNCSA|nr:hypothetical protein [Candidatus Saganbacteria bacterium]